MGRYKKSESSKAKPVCFSLDAKSIEYLEFLESFLNKNRSQIIQDLIAIKYKEVKNTYEHR